MKRWTFLTNYGHVLLCIAADPSIRLIDIAGQVEMRHPAERKNNVGALLKLLSRKPVIAGVDSFQSKTQEASGPISETQANEAS